MLEWWRQVQRGAKENMITQNMTWICKYVSTGGRRYRVRQGGAW